MLNMTWTWLDLRVPHCYEVIAYSISKSKWRISYFLIHGVSKYLSVHMQALFFIKETKKCVAKRESHGFHGAYIWIFVCLFMKIYRTSKHGAFQDHSLWWRCSFRSNVLYYVYSSKIWPMTCWVEIHWVWFLMVQLLRLHASTAGGEDLIP